jgi:DNA-binding response OmpR family regulator
MQMNENAPPVIVMSATTQGEMDQVNLDIDVADIVCKPFDISTLLERISNVLSEHTTSKPE